MAENKKSFLLYCDLIHTIGKMPNEKAGELFKHILMYVNDKDPVTDDLIIQLTFEPIKQQLKRDLVKWIEFTKKQSENGRMGGRPKTHTNPNKGLGYLDNPTEPKKAVTVTVTDTVNVNDNVKESDSEPPAQKLNGKVFFIPAKLDDFKPPTFAEVKQCFAQQKPNDWDYTKSLVLAEKFHTNYEANGWTINGVKIGNWQATVKKWILKEIETPKNGNKQSVADRHAAGINNTLASLAEDINLAAAGGGYDYPT